MSRATAEVVPGCGVGPGVEDSDVYVAVLPARDAVLMSVPIGLGVFSVLMQARVSIRVRLGFNKEARDRWSWAAIDARIAGLALS